MSTQTIQGFASPSRLLSQITAIIVSFARAIAMAGNSQERFDEIQYLQSLTDEELARRNIARDDIIRHVYADLMAD
jgi:hypothetical protein